MYLVSGHLLFNFFLTSVNCSVMLLFLSPAKSPDPLAEQKIHPEPFLKLGQEKLPFKLTLNTLVLKVFFYL